MNDLVEGEDFYWEDGLVILSPAFLLRRGKCCKSRCKNCPYGFRGHNHLHDEVNGSGDSERATEPPLEES